MSEKGVSAANLKAFLEEAQGVERDLWRELEAKAKRAMIFGWAMFALAVMGLASAIGAYNQPRPEPLMLRVDNTTGAVERITTLAEDQVTSSEADDTHWINRFIIARESYDYNTIQETHDMAMLLSGSEVAREYDAIYSGPRARDVVWQDNHQLKVSIRSITPDLNKRTAVVRFTTQKFNKSSGARPDEPQFWIAYLRYTYVAGAEMAAEDRWKNPKAFQVLSYRVDPEIFSGK